MINAVIGKTMESVRNHWHIKLFTTERRRNYLVSEPSYHTAKFFTQNLLAIEMKKSKILMNKTVYWGLSILELSKILSKTKIWWKSEIMLYGYRHCTHKNRWIYREIEGDVETRTFQLMK